MKATLYLILATALWGLNYHFAKLVLAEVDFLEGGFWRYAFAVGTLFLVNIKKLPPFAVFKQNLKNIFAIGAIGLFGFNLFFFSGMSTTSGVNGALIIGLNPALTLLFSRLILKTEIKRIHILGISIAFLGVLYLLLKGQILDILQLRFNEGDILVLIAAVFFALHHVWVKKYYIAEVSTQQFTFMTALVCLLCFSLVLPFFPVAPLSTHSTSFWIGGIGVGVFGTGLSYIFWNKGVHAVGASTAGVFVNVVPLSAGLSAVFFGEQLHSYHFVSGLLIILGLLIMQYKTR